jgi:beta-glucosidase
MQTTFKTSLQVVLLFFVAALAYVACSSQPTGTVVTGGGSPGAGGSSGANPGPTGGPVGSAGDNSTGNTAGSNAGDSTTGPGPGPVGMGAGGAGTGAGGAGVGGMGMGGTGPVPGECMSFTPVRANMLQPLDASVTPLVQSLSTAEKLSITNGDASVCGPAGGFSCDFDGTGVAATGSHVAIPNFKMRDGPRGVHNLALGPTTTWAVAEARAASFDDALELAVGQIQGKEMRALKFDLSLAPVINTLRHPGWARAQETYGEDPYLLGKMGAAFIKGLQETVPACPKHFVGNDTDNNRQSVITTMDEQTLRENYARPFQILVEESDPACIMAAYNGINEGAKGTWCAGNGHLLTDILRTDWKWTGFVISDWWATKATPGFGVQAFNNGLDYEMPDSVAFVALPQAVQGGQVTTARVNEAATRMLNARIKFQQLTAAYQNSPLTADPTNVQASRDLARRTEEEGAVLLKNDGVLPLGPKGAAMTGTGTGLATAKTILFLGPDAGLPNTNVHTAMQASGLGDRGSSDIVPPHAVSFIAGLRAHAATAANGITITTAATLPAGPTFPDVIIIPVSMAHEDEGEAYDGGRDRQDLRLNGAHPIHWGATKPSALINQVAAAAPTSKIVVLLMVGGAVVMEDWWTKAHAIIHTFYPGQEGGDALARLLYGDISFSGKLPFTVAMADADYPAFQNNGTTGTIDYFHGYRKIENDKKTARFWFGYGMSYNTYEYSNLQVLCPNGISTTGRLQVEVTVKNTGKMAGDEIVQLYIGYPNSTLRHPVKELKAYARVSLMPGESKVVPLSVNARDIAHWDMASNGWLVEKVVHQVLVGPSADPTKLLPPVNFTIN